MLEKEFEKNAVINFSEDLDLFFVLMKIAVYEKDDLKFKEFIEEVSDVQKMKEYLVYEKIEKDKNKIFHEKLLKLFKYFNEQYNNFENIKMKQYSCNCYIDIKFTVRMVMESKAKKIEKFIKDESLFLTITKVIELYSAEEIYSLNLRCLELVNNIENIKSYKYKLEYISIMQEIIIFLMGKREKFIQEGTEYCLAEDILISLFGIIQIEYNKSFIKRGYNFTTIYNSTKNYFKFDELLTVISVLEKECSRCMETKLIIASKIKEIVDDYYGVMKIKRRLGTFFKGIKKEMRTIEKHLEKEHNYFNTIRLNKILAISKFSVMIFSGVLVSVLINSYKVINDVNEIIAGIAFLISGYIFDYASKNPVRNILKNKKIM